MPAKNCIKQYLENGYYHIYNRGVEKRDIFQDKQDYSVFLSYLKEYLMPKDKKLLMEQISDQDISYREKDKIIKSLRMNNFFEEISLFAYCLMTNHFHLLLKQSKISTIHYFIKSICTRYAMYFNRKYKRIGHLFQGIYKAVLVNSDEQLLYLTRYIHRQALNLQGDTLSSQEMQPCSYGEYLGIRKTAWIKPEEILKQHYNRNPHLSYEQFVHQSQSTEIINNFLIEE